MKPLAICAWFFCFLSSAFGGADAIPARVTGDSVNLRTGPSRRADILGQLAIDTEVRVVLTDGEWSAILPPDGIGGWISRDYLAEGVVTADRVNVRAGPSVAYGILLTLDEGTEVSVLEEGEGWAKIALPDTARLWLNSRYLSTGPAPPAMEAVAVPQPVRPLDPERPAPAADLPSRTPLPVESKPAPRSVGPVSRPGELRSYTGIIRDLEQPFFLADREYEYELAADRHAERPIAFLAGDTVDLSGYRFRPVRVWAETVEARPGHPALLEVKGVGFIW